LASAQRYKTFFVRNLRILNDLDYKKRKKNNYNFYRIGLYSKHFIFFVNLEGGGKINLASKTLADSAGERDI